MQWNQQRIFQTLLLSSPYKRKKIHPFLLSYSSTPAKIPLYIIQRDFLYPRIALWKCGKRPLHRWKTNIHGPMEKLSAFPQPANIVSHSSASMTVYAHSHSAYYGEYPSCPILMERDKREQKMKRERHPWLKPKAALPLCNGKVFKIAALHPSNQRERPA